MKPLMRLILAGVFATVLGPGFFPPSLNFARVDGREVTAESLQSVQLPYVFDDPSGMQWNVQPDGSLGPGNFDVFDAGGRLYLDQNAQYIAATPQAQLDPRHGELVLPPVAVAGLMVSRKVSVNFREGRCRWINLIENQDVTARRVSVRINFDLGSSQPGGAADQRSKGKRPAARCDLL